MPNYTCERCGRSWWRFTGEPKSREQWTHDGKGELCTWFTRSEVAKMLGTDRKSARNLERKMGIVTRELPNGWHLWSPEDVQRVVAKRTRQ